MWDSHFLTTGGQNAACKPDKPGSTTRKALVSCQGSDPPPKNKLSEVEEQRQGLLDGVGWAGGRKAGGLSCSSVQPRDCQAEYLCTPVCAFAHLRLITVWLLLFLLSLRPGLGVQRCPVRNDTSPSVLCREVMLRPEGMLPSHGQEQGLVIPGQRRDEWGTLW